MTEQDLFDLTISTDWEYDWDFVRLIEESARRLDLKTYIVWPENLAETMDRLHHGRLDFRSLFDRASDTTPGFFALQQRMREKGRPVLELLEKLRWASDKATMHLEFISSGLHTPFTIILPPVDSDEKAHLSLEDLNRLGCPFIVKPANTTGGSIGVMVSAATIRDILEARQRYRSDKYLIQEKVIPIEKDGLRFWFRGFYSCGLVQCAWWNDQSKFYLELTTSEVEVYRLHRLFDIVEKIAEVSRLHFFSTEIALAENGSFLVIDYVNESCDMRLQSRYPDGVPDCIVRNIAWAIASHMKKMIGE